MNPYSHSKKCAFAFIQVEGILSNRVKAHACEDAEALLLRYQVVQRSMDKNSANLTDEWCIDQQKTTELEKFDLLPCDEMVAFRKLWNDCLGPPRSKLQALNVVIDPRIWELERKGVIKLDVTLIKRAELAYDNIVDMMVDDQKRPIVNKTWLALRNARKARLNPDVVGVGDSVFNNIAKVSLASIIGSWRWWRIYAGVAHSEFVQNIARVVLNIRYNASATERAKSMVCTSTSSDFLGAE